MNDSIEIPLYGTVEIPEYILSIIEEPCIRRLRFIKQLGLNSFTKYYSANHTRFEHSIGTMHLAEKLTNHLINSADNELKSQAGYLNAKRKEVITAAFLHDIGHGPFSHVMDEVLKIKYDLKHEDMVPDLIENKLSDFFKKYDVDYNDVCKIIQGKHEQIFLNDIIHGDLDVDRMDYLLRDAHHVDRQYKYGSDPLINVMRLVKTKITELKEEEFKNELEKLPTKLKNIIEPKFQELSEECRVGVLGSEGVVYAETLLIIRKSMYTSVYFEEQSRIVEKMLEKAIIKLLDNGETDLKNPEIYGTLDDYEIFRLLQNSPNEFCKEMPYRIRYGTLYTKYLDIDTKEINREFKRILLDENNLLLNIIKKEAEISSELEIEPERVIIDYFTITGLKHQTVYVKEKIDDIYAVPLEKLSPIANSLVESDIARLKLYIDKKYLKLDDDAVKSKMEEYFLKR